MCNIFKRWKCSNFDVQLGGYKILLAGRTDRFFKSNFTAGSQETQTINVPDKNQQHIYVASSTHITGSTADAVDVRITNNATSSINVSPTLRKTISSSVSVYVDYIILGK